MTDKVDGYYKQHGKLVFNYLYQLTRSYDLSEELTQETFYQAMRTVDNYKGDCKPSVWLCQIAKHLWYRYLEKNTKGKTVPIDEIESFPDEGNTCDGFLERQDKIGLYMKIHTLKKDMREVIYLRLSGDLSFAEIGEILGKTENWARVTFYRAKQQLMKGDYI